MVDLQAEYSEASATSLRVGNKGHTPDPSQQNPTGQTSQHEWLWKVDGLLRCWGVECASGTRHTLLLVLLGVFHDDHHDGVGVIRGRS